jgi:peptidyl-prolyl cis-trans isomerase C
MKKLIYLLVLAGAVGLATSNSQSTNNKPAGSGRSLTDLFGDPLVAKGTNFEIKRSQLDAELSRTKQALTGSGRPTPPDVDKQVLDGMIGLKLLLSRATEADRAKAKEQFEKQFDTFRTERKMTQQEFDEKLAPQLKLEGRTKADWEQQQIEQATIPIVIQRELKASPTEEEAKKYYEENTAKFEEPETVRVSHVLLSTRDPNDPNPNPALKKELPDDQKKAKKKRIEELLKQARDGADFAKLARESSEDPGIKQNNGEYKFSREDPFVEEFKAAAFALKNTNQISDVVTTAFGYHIIKLLERTPARKEPYTGLDTKTIYSKGDGTKFAIRDVLKEEALRKQLPDFIKTLRQEAKVEILDPKLKLEETPSTASAAEKK